MKHKDNTTPKKAEIEKYIADNHRKIDFNILASMFKEVNNNEHDSFTGDWIIALLNNESLNDWDKKTIINAALEVMIKSPNLITLAFVQGLLNLKHSGYKNWNIKFADDAIAEMPSDYITKKFLISTLESNSDESTAICIIARMNSKLITSDLLVNILRIKNLPVFQKSNIVCAAIAKMPTDLITEEFVKNLLEEEGLDDEGKTKIATTALIHMKPDLITEEFVGYLLENNWQYLDISRNRKFSDIAIKLILLNHTLNKRHVTNDTNLMTIVGRYDYNRIVEERLGYSTEDLASYINKYIDSDNYVSCVEKLLPSLSFVRSLCYHQLINENNDNITSEVLGKMIESSGFMQANTLLEGINDHKKILDAIASSGLSDHYSALKNVELNTSIENFIKDNDIEKFKAEMGLNRLTEDEFKNTKLIDLLIFAEIKTKAHILFNYISEDRRKDIQDNYQLPSNKAYLTKQENDFLKALWPIDSSYSNLPNYTSLCEKVKDISDETREDKTYKQLEEEGVKEYKLTFPEDTNEEFSTKANNAFQELFNVESTEPNTDRVRNFISAIAEINVITELIYDKEKNYFISEENLKKVFEVFTERKNDILYAFQNAETLTSIVLASISAGDGCVANYGTVVDQAIQKTMMKSYPEQKLYNVLQDIFAAINLNNPDDILGASAHSDFLKNDCLLEATINPLGLIHKLALEIEDGDFSNNEVKVHFTNFFKKYNEASINLVQPEEPYDKQLLALEILKNTLPLEEYDKIKGIYFLHLESEAKNNGDVEKATAAKNAIEFASYLHLPTRILKFLPVEVMSTMQEKRLFRSLAPVIEAIHDGIEAIHDGRDKSGGATETVTKDEALALISKFVTKYGNSKGTDAATEFLYNQTFQRGNTRLLNAYNAGRKEDGIKVGDLYKTMHAEKYLKPFEPGSEGAKKARNVVRNL